MTDTQAGVVIALTLLAYLALVAAVTRDPRLCKSCGLPCPRRHTVRHLLNECPALTGNPPTSQEPSHV